jgi:hypothetical protein
MYDEIMQTRQHAHTHTPFFFSPTTATNDAFGCGGNDGKSPFGKWMCTENGRYLGLAFTSAQSNEPIQIPHGNSIEMILSDAYEAEVAGTKTSVEMARKRPK